MPGGIPINRQWIYMLKDGTPVVDWGDDRYQDIHTGEFITVEEKDISHVVSDADLDVLMRAAVVVDYDAQTAYVYNLPEPPHRTLD